MITILDLKTSNKVQENGRITKQRITINLFSGINKNNPLQEIKWFIEDLKNNKHANLCLL